MNSPWPAFTATAVQAAPVYLDRQATVDKACALSREAGRAGARGFPHWIYLDRPQANERHFVELVREAVEVLGPTTEALGRATRDASAYVVIRANKRSRRSAGELFNTIGMEITGPETWQLLSELRRRAGTASSEEVRALVESLLASLPAGLT
jgi:hypothetical protein